MNKQQLEKFENTIKREYIKNKIEYGLKYTENYVKTFGKEKTNIKLIIPEIFDEIILTKKEEEGIYAEIKKTFNRTF